MIKIKDKDKNTDKNCKQCGKRENMKHIYMCKLSQEDTELKYETIFGENLEQMKQVTYNSKPIMTTKKARKQL